MKTCTKCGSNLPVSAFNKHSQTRDGLRPKCRECQSEEYRIYSQSEKGRAAKKAYAQSDKGQAVYLKSDRKRNQTEHRRKYKREKARTPRYRKLKNDWTNEHRKHPEQRIRIEANYAVRNALRNGEITRGPCELVDNGDCYGNPQGHHDDYSKPLDVRWLCPRHHTQLHRSS